MRFLCNVYPCMPFFPYFCYYFYLFGPLPPTKGARVTCFQYGMGRVWTLRRLCFGHS